MIVNIPSLILVRKNIIFLCFISSIILGFSGIYVDGVFFAPFFCLLCFF